MTTHIHLGDKRSAPLSSLLDTGASLSTIDAELLARLGGAVSGEPMRVQGLGAMQTLGWATLKVFLPARTDHGTELFLETEIDFHVLPKFAPGICLGQDFIDGHGLVIDASTHKAHIKRFSFDVFSHMPAPFASDAPLCATADVCLPPRSLTWVPVDTSALSADVDYTFHVRAMLDRDETVALGGPHALGSRETNHVLVGNHSDRPVHLPRRTPVADACAARLGDIHERAADAEQFTLGAPLPDALVKDAQHSPNAWRPDDDEGDVEPPAAPLDAYADSGDPVSELCRDAETVLVDERFRVGVAANGEPHAPVVELLRRHHAAFALDGRPGLVKDEEMHIPLVEGAELRSEPPRRASPEKRAAMDAAIDQLLDWNVIEESSSSVSFPVVMVRQNGKWRFCVDYRRLNAATVADRYPLPTTDAIFQTLQGKRWFSSLDAIRGYHQHLVARGDRWKTAFVCHRGLYQYRTVPFGLRNAPAVFQRLMDKILGPLRWRTAVVYIDDVVAATASLAEHLETLDYILTRASEAGLKFSPAKCTFAVPSLTLLGRKVSAAGVAVWEERAKAVADLPAPKTLREVYHTLGLFGYYRAFVDRFAAIAEPLTRLTRGWKYEAGGERARLVRQDGTPANADKEPVEWGPEQERSFAALKRAIASPPVLAHPDPARPYLLYVDASKQGLAAVLHQIHADEDIRACAQLHASAPPSDAPVSRERWTTWLRADRLWGPLLRQLESDPQADAEWVLEDGVLVRRVDGRWALPESGLPVVLRGAHDDSGHFGYTKTLLAVSRRFWRPKLAEAVRAWVAHCGVCQRTKVLRRVGELDVTQDAQTPFETIAFDLVLGFPPSHGRDAVLAILCTFSRMVLLEPCKSTIDAAGIAAIISNRVLRLGWRPRRIISDSEPRNTGVVLTALADSLGATLTPSPPHHQQANAAERAIQTVQQALRGQLLSGAASWDRAAVPAVELAMNSTPSVVHGYRPFDLVFVSHPESVHALLEEGGLGAGESIHDRLLAATERLEDARRAIAEARAQQKARYDTRRAPLPVLTAGDQVYVRLGDRPIPGLGGGKLDPKKAGPFAVREVLSPHRVRLALPSDLRIGDEFAVDQLDVCPGPARPPNRSPASSLPELVAGPSTTADDGTVPDAATASRPARARHPPVGLRDFDLGVQHALGPEHLELLRTPLRGPRQVELDGRSVTLREHPVSYQSRLTTVSEKRMVAAELELVCLAWSFGRLAHLLEGALVTVVTDHAPMERMLTSDSGAQYGPVISRCRALLLPHLPNLRFVHKPGRLHSNVDALSRLVG